MWFVSEIQDLNYIYNQRSDKTEGRHFMVKTAAAIVIEGSGAYVTKYYYYYYPFDSLNRIYLKFYPFFLDEVILKNKRNSLEKLKKVLLSHNV